MADPFPHDPGRDNNPGGFSRGGIASAMPEDRKEGCIPRLGTVKRFLCPQQSQRAVSRPNICLVGSTSARFVAREKPAFLVMSWSRSIHQTD
jgi:hypothetical protein